MNKCAIRAALAAAGLAFATAVSAQYSVNINMVDQNGVGKSIGQIKISAAATGGVTFTPDLKGLPPGTHGFHVHEHANCGPKTKDGKMEPGEAAGPHYDPEKSGRHAGPQGGGHIGDLPALQVDASGAATQAVTAPRLALSQLKGRSLMIHAGGDNNTDQPPNGGGGARIACGVIN